MATGDEIIKPGRKQKISSQRARDAEDANQQVTHFHRRVLV
jgi:hypothetical protein